MALDDVGSLGPFLFVKMGVMLDMSVYVKNLKTTFLPFHLPMTVLNTENIIINN